MKINILIIATLALAACIGCKTVSTVTTAGGVTTTNTTTVFDLNKATNAIAKATPPIVRYVTDASPVTSLYFQDVVVAINLFATGSDLSPGALEAAIKSTGIREIQTKEVTGGIDAIVAAYQGFWQQAVDAKVATVPNLVPILQNLANGIQAGLTTP